MRIISLVCPRCGSTLENVRLADGINTCYCTYCGTMIALQDENQYTYRQVDAARIKEAELNQAIRLKELEMEERRREDQKKSDASKAKLAIVLAAIGVLMMIIGFVFGSASNDKNSPLYYIALVGFFPLLGAGFIGITLLPSRNRRDE